MSFHIWTFIFVCFYFSDFIYVSPAVAPQPSEYFYCYHCAGDGCASITRNTGVCKTRQCCIIIKLNIRETKVLIGRTCAPDEFSCTAFCNMFHGAGVVVDCKGCYGDRCNYLDIKDIIIRNTPIRVYGKCTPPIFEKLIRIKKRDNKAAGKCRTNWLLVVIIIFVNIYINVV